MTHDPQSAVPLWAPLFCKICSRRAAIVIDDVLMCGDCFFKHSVGQLAQPAEGWTGSCAETTANAAVSLRSAAGAGRSDNGAGRGVSPAG